MTQLTPKHARYHQRGPVPQDVIAAEPFALPALQAGQALMEVVAAAINPSDVLTLTGHYGMLPPLPAVGGNEGVGRVLEVAADVSRLAPGQLVLLPIGSGTWTTHLIADATQLLALPAGADPRQLAMLTVNPPTAALLLSEFADLKPGDWVVQNAANSAVGGYVVQLAKARGLRTVNVVRRDAACQAVLDLGAELVLVDGDDLAARVKQATDAAKIALGIDAVGGLATERLAQCVASGGMVVNYGAMSGAPCAISPASLIFRGIRLQGFWLAQWYKTATPEARAALFGELVRLIASGALHARIQATYSLDQIKEAIAAAASGERDGKIVLLPNGEPAAQ
ncbi:MAG: zinc-dependent alcohol dehydrogenase family protein [Thermomonas sp.]